MSNYQYTHAFEDLGSSLVWDVWYDEPTKTAYLDLNGEVYAYENVPFDAVETLVQASSVGRAYNGTLFNKGFKQSYGPGTHISDVSYFSVNAAEREAATTAAAPGVVPKNLTYAPNASASHVGAYVSLGNSNTTATPAPRVRLATDEANPEVHKRAMTVHFESNGSRTHSLRAESVDEAVDAVKKVAEMLGVNVMVTGVFVHLG